MTTKEIAQVETHPLTLAEELYTIQGQMAFLKEQEDEIRAKLLLNLQEQGIKSVKLSDGTSYIRTERQTLKIKDEDKAKKWLDDNFAWKPDTGKALKILRRSLKKLPSYFTVSVSEFLTVKRDGKQDDEE